MIAYQIEHVSTTFREGSHMVRDSFLPMNTAQTEYDIIYEIYEMPKIQ